MPRYEYKCKFCGNLVEVEQGINERPLSVCWKCKGRLERLIGMTSFQLKGSGWSADGYTRPKRIKDNDND